MLNQNGHTVQVSLPSDRAPPRQIGISINHARLNGNPNRL
jgi:hypothetical protein